MSKQRSISKSFLFYPQIRKPLIAPFVPEKITIPNPSSLVQKLNNLKNLPQIDFISDFDYTLTKFRHEGKQCDSLFGMWVKGDHLPMKFKESLIENYKQFGPYQTDGTISFEDRAYLIHQLYKNQLKTFERFGITEEMVGQVMNRSNLVYRSHTKQLFQLLLEQNCPLYIISGGISDLIHNFNFSLSQRHFQNISIHSNELEKYKFAIGEHRDKSFVKFKKKIIHSFNKYKVMNDFERQKHCILMGDLISDIYMAEGNNYQTILSIFYAKEGENDQRGLAEKKYDVIVQGDCSHRILIELLKFIYQVPGVDWRYLYSTNSNLHQLLI